MGTDQVLTVLALAYYVAAPGLLLGAARRLGKWRPAALAAGIVALLFTLVYVVICAGGLISGGAARWASVAIWIMGWPVAFALTVAAGASGALYAILKVRVGARQ